MLFKRINVPNAGPSRGAEISDPKAQRRSIRRHCSLRRLAYKIKYQAQTVNDARMNSRLKSETVKRGRPLVDSLNLHPGGSKCGNGYTKMVPKHTKGPISEMVRDHLQVAIVDEKATKKIMSSEL